MSELDLATVQRWLDAYLGAWASNEPAQVGPLFAVDGRYRGRPDEDFVVGRDAIVRYWAEHLDEPGSWRADLAPLLVQGATAIITGNVDYPGLGERFSNLWVLRFAADGTCAEFTEWWMLAPS